MRIRPKVVWKVVHGLMYTITRTKTKKLFLYVKFNPLFFPRKTYVIHHPVIAAILDVILNILHR